MKSLFLATIISTALVIVIPEQTKQAPAKPTVTTEQKLHIAELTGQEYRIDGQIKQRQLEIVQLQFQLQGVDKQLSEFTAGLCKADGWKFDLGKSECVAEPKPEKTPEKSK